jgi:hypothetical protein
MSVTILASRYNSLRDLVNQVLGVSVGLSPTYGYGQAFNTTGVTGTREVTPITDADKISAQDYENLYIDLIRLRSHQIGSSLAIQEFVVGDYETNPETADKIEEAYVLGLESLAANIATDRFTVAPDNLTIASLPDASSTRLASAGSWNGSISHFFAITFNNVTERRHFFNAGGEIRLSASVNYTGSQSKTVDWQVILNAMGTISFKAQSTVNNKGIGTGSNIGNYGLTTTYQLIYSTTGGSVYARNRYNIYAAESVTLDGTSQIKFKVEFVDGLPNDLTFGIDEAVFGTFNSTVSTAIPSSQIIINGTTHDAVVIPNAPIGNNIRVLLGTVLPEYNIGGPTTVNEGVPATFTVTTNNVQNNTTLYWTTNSLSSPQPVGSDFTDGLTSGNVVVNNNTAIITRTPSSDQATEGVENFSISLRTQSVSGPIVAISNSVSINDTSTTAPVPPPEPPAPEPDPVPPAVPEPPAESFTFSVTPTQSSYTFNEYLRDYPGNGQVFTMSGTGGSGTVTVQEISRPTAWNVYVDNIKGSNDPFSIATKNFTLSNGQTKTVLLNVEALTIGTGSGSFAFLGGGTTITKSWTGTAIPNLPSISFTPSSGIVNDTLYTLAWDDGTAGSRTVSLTSPESTVVNISDPSKSITSTLGIVGTWSASIVTSSGSASASVTVNPAPPPAPVIPSPSISFSPSSGTINDTLYTLSWNANGAPSATVTVTTSTGETSVLTDLTGSITSTLGIAGTWTATIQTAGGSASRSVTVNPAPPPPPPEPEPVIPAPSLSFGPSSGKINSTTFTLAWNANGASSASVLLRNPLGETISSSELTGNLSSTLGVVGTWIASISTPGGFRSGSISVTP